MNSLKKIIDYLLAGFLFLWPWQTVWLWREGILNGEKWQYGTLAFYGTEALLLLVVILSVLNFCLSRKFSIFNFQFSMKVSASPTIKMIILLFLFWAGLSIIWSGDRSLSFYWWLKLAEGIILFFLILNSRWDFKKISWPIIAAGVVQAVLALGQFLAQGVAGNKWLGLAAHWPGDLGAVVIEANGFWLRPYGSFSHPNVLGGFLALAFLLAVTLYFQNYWSKPKKGLWVLAAILILVTGLFLSFSRSAWLAGVVGFLILIFGQFWPARIAMQSVAGGPARNASRSDAGGPDKKMFFRAIRNFSLYLLFLILALTAACWPLVFSRLSAQENLEKISIERRLSLMSGASQTIKSQWFLGTGIGNYTFYAYEQNPTARASSYQPVHNIYLLVWAELGIVGLVIFGFLILSLLWYFWPARKATLSVAGGRQSFVGLALFVPLLVMGLFDHFFWTQYAGMVMWWLGVGIAMKVKN